MHDAIEASEERPRRATSRPTSGVRMQYRTLGRTGIKVSPYALGAPALGTSIGNPDHAPVPRPALFSGPRPGRGCAGGPRLSASPAARVLRPANHRRLMSP